MFLRAPRPLAPKLGRHIVRGTIVRWQVRAVNQVLTRVLPAWETVSQALQLRPCRSRTLSFYTTASTVTCTLPTTSFTLFIWDVMGMKILFSVTYVDANVKTSMILPVILQEGNITNTDGKQSRYALLGLPFCVL